MSSHALSASGRRPLSLTVNDDARTSAQVPAKKGDAVALHFGGFTRVEISVPLNARVERRRYADGFDRNVLVVEHPESPSSPVSSVQAYGVCEVDPDGYGMPHTSLDVRRPSGKQNPVDNGREHEVIEVIDLPDMTQAERKA